MILAALASVAVAWSLAVMPPFPPKRGLKRPGADGILVQPPRPGGSTQAALDGVLRQHRMTLVEQAFSRYGLGSGHARWQAFGAPAAGIPMLPMGQPALRPSAQHWHLAPPVPEGWGQP